MFHILNFFQITQGVINGNNCVDQDGWTGKIPGAPTFTLKLATLSGLAGQSCFYALYCEIDIFKQSFTLYNAASATSKSPQVKTTEPMVSINVSNCSIQLG